MSTPATSHDKSDAERREEAQAWRLEQAEAQVRAARRAAEEHEQTTEVLTLRTLQRIEALLEDRLPLDPRGPERERAGLSTRRGVPPVREPV
jgi:hypothetical protein